MTLRTVKLLSIRFLFHIRNTTFNKQNTDMLKKEFSKPPDHLLLIKMNDGKLNYS